MKSMFKKLHRTAWVAFTLMTVLMILCLFLFGQWPGVMLLLWFCALALLTMVLIGCIVQSVHRHWQAGKMLQLALRYAGVAAAAFAVLCALDWTTGTIGWKANLEAGLLTGIMGLYERP